MLTMIQIKKSFFSSWFLVFFALTLIVGASISDFFQTPANTPQEFNHYRLLIDKKKLFDFDKISLKNDLGSFQFTKIHDHSWNLISPRELPANTSTLKEIFQAIRNIKIRKVYLQDPINISNFSLDNPPIELSFSNINDPETLKMQIGLTNPIDNSTYVMLSNKEIIYHIDNFKYSLESLSLTDFVDSKIFTFNQTDISSLKIFRSDPKFNNMVLEINNSDDVWISRRNRELSSSKVDEFISQLISLKGSLILDKRDKKLNKALARYLKRPLYTIQIKSKQSDDIITYTVSSVVNSLPEIKIEKKQTFIMTASNRPHPYILNKQFLNLFNTTPYSLRKVASRSR